MNKNKKKSPSFIIVFTSIIFVFTTLILLSIPVLFDYESLENEIEKKIYAEFKIDIEILDDISYKILPSPHILIKDADLYLNANNKESSIIETNDIKIFIPIKNLYSKSKVEINKLEIVNSNIKFKLQDVKDFRNHLFYKINKPITIKKSKFFYLDENNNTLLISPIYKLNYLINSRGNFKELKIKGNIFNSDYESNWRRYYYDPKNTHHEIKFKNPNIFIKNFFNLKTKSNFKGKISANFLNEYLIINYSVNNNKIIITSPAENNKQKIKIFSDIELDPFYFNSQIYLIEKNSNFLINDLFYFIINLDKNYLGNLNGNLVFNIENLDNQIIDNGKINININEKTIKISEAVFEIKDAGSIKSKFHYIEKQGDLIFKSNNVLEIKNIKEFAKKFQLNQSKIKKVNKIYFDLEKNIESGEFSISNIHLNKINLDKKSSDFTTLKNIQSLRNLLRDYMS